MSQFIEDYNSEVHRHQLSSESDWPERISWSRDLKQDALRGRTVKLAQDKFRISLYRPFTKRWLYFDRILNEEVYQWENLSGRSICITAHSQVPFGVLSTDTIPNEAPGGRQGQCFPVSQLTKAAISQFRRHYTDERINAESVFHYIYALLHHPEYR